LFTHILLTWYIPCPSHSCPWIGLDWIGLGLENWTHGHLWSKPPNCRSLHLWCTDPPDPELPNSPLTTIKAVWTPLYWPHFLRRFLSYFRDMRLTPQMSDTRSWS